MNIATILAAGQGKRFGAEVPKQFIEVLGKPVLAWTLETFQRSPDIDAIQIICQPETASSTSFATTGLTRSDGSRRAGIPVPSPYETGFMPCAAA